MRNSGHTGQSNTQIEACTHRQDKARRSWLPSTVGKVLGLRPAPEFEDWLKDTGTFEQANDDLRLAESLPKPFQRALEHLH